jgi:hypothetical protein
MPGKAHIRNGTSPDGKNEKDDSINSGECDMRDMETIFPCTESVPMYRGLVEKVRPRAVCPGILFSVLKTLGKCSRLRAKPAYISGHLPPATGMLFGVSVLLFGKGNSL